MPFFAKFSIAEKLAECKNTKPKQKQNQRKRQRHRGNHRGRETERESKGKTKRNETNFIKLDVTETKSLKLGPQPRRDLTNQPGPDCNGDFRGH